MIVRNEAERLERCLASVAGFVDEMVVVDTGSGDGTPEIAAACGARVHHLDWPGDFAPARNHALDLVSGDWVLVLDADEWLRPEARAPLRALMEQPRVLLVNLLRQELGAAQSPYSSVSRLFRRHPAIRWGRRYHAMVDDSVAALLEQEPDWQVVACPEPALLHEGYRPELVARHDKAARLRAAMEAELAARPGDPYACAKLGSLEVARASAAGASPCWRRVWPVPGPTPTPSATNCCSTSPSPAAPRSPRQPPRSTARPWPCPSTDGSAWGRGSTWGPCCCARGSWRKRRP